MGTIQNFFSNLKGEAMRVEDRVLDVVESGIDKVESRAKAGGCRQRSTQPTMHILLLLLLLLIILLLLRVCVRTHSEGAL